MQKTMSKHEFIAITAMMFATIAFSIDSMLPALPEIGRELTPDDLNRAQLIIGSFVLGMGLGTFFTGPLSDAFGRKPVILIGCALFILASVLALFAESLELILVARVVQGLGAAAPRIVSVAIIRDMYSGREMARLMSIAMVIFTLFPAFAPAMGAVIIAFSGWRGIFVAFIVFAAILMLWLGLRLPEPLTQADRRPMKAALLWAALLEILHHPVVRLSILVQTLCLSTLFCMILMVQPIYDVIFDRAESFPIWFGGVALVAASASILNAALVVRLGMRRIVIWTLAAQVVLAGLMIPISLGNLSLPVLFGLFVFWQTTVFFQAGTTLGNLNAMAMEPMGHIAGMAASVVGAVSTVLSTAIAAPIGLLFDGTMLPLSAGIFMMSVIALLLMLQIARIEAREPFA
jgi:DHA1 family bicyclomycin/chloramphenicol resistance-like MFS transporter